MFFQYQYQFTPVATALSIVCVCVCVCVCVRVHAIIMVIKELVCFADRFTVKHRDSRESSSLTDPGKSSSTCRLHVDTGACGMHMDVVYKIQMKVQ